MEKKEKEYLRLVVCGYVRVSFKFDFASYVLSLNVSRSDHILELVVIERFVNEGRQLNENN